MVAQVNRSIMHPVYIVQGVSNAHCAIRSMVQRFICINDGVATDLNFQRYLNDVAHFHEETDLTQLHPEMRITLMDTSEEGSDNER